MELTKYEGGGLWQPFVELADFSSEIEQLLNTFWGSPSRRRERDSCWYPRVDVHETKDAYLLQVDLPGLKQEDIKVSVADNTLVIKGERKLQHEEEETYKRTERYHGKFIRSFQLPDLVDATTIEATYKNGVLELRLPRVAVAKPKEIAVQVT